MSKRGNNDRSRGVRRSEIQRNRQQMPMVQATPNLYASASHVHAASDVTSGVFLRDRLGSGSYSTSSFLRGDGTWQPIPAAASGGGGTKTYSRFTPITFQAPASGNAALDTRNSVAVLDFDDSAVESAFWVDIMPEGASLSAGLFVDVHWWATSASGSQVVWTAKFERMNTDIDTDSWDTIFTATGVANAASGIKTTTRITATSIDGITAGDPYRMMLTRLASAAADNMAGDAEVFAVEVRSAE